MLGGEARAAVQQELHLTPKPADVEQLEPVCLKLCFDQIISSYLSNTFITHSPLIHSVPA